MPPTDNVVRNFIGEAIWAPSGDNSQPWEFSWDGVELKVFCVPEKDNRILNFNSNGTYLAIGALLENLEIVARSNGFKMICYYFPDLEVPLLVASLRFEPSRDDSHPLADVIRERHTNRKAYSTEALSLEERRAIIDSVAGTECMVRLVENKLGKDSIAKTCSEMERIALETPSLHKLFFESLVWSREEESQRGGGLYVNTLELPAPILGLFRMVRHWPVTAFLNRIGFSKAAAAGNSKIYASSAALGAIIIKDSTRKSFVSSGRALQMLWLVATKLKLSLQPVTGMTFLFQRWRAGQLAMLGKRHVAITEKAYQEFVRGYGLSDEEIVAIHFRIGHAAAATARSSRAAPKISIKAIA